MSRKKICFVVTIPEIVHAFLKKHIEALSADYDVYLVGDIKSQDNIEGLSLKGFLDVKISRKISLLDDLKAVWILYRYFKVMKFDVVHSAMPKAGLLTALAGFGAKISNRIHIFTGQVWATKTGFMRIILKLADKFICSLDNYILVDGKSQRDFLVGEGVLKEKKGIVFGEGSICGVDVDRFNPSGLIRQAEREKYHISDNSFAYVFLGRLNHDKGTFDLLKAFNRLAFNKDDVFLFLAGADEEKCLDRLDDYPNVKLGENLFYMGYVKDPELYLQIGDVFCLPSYREGFGSSIIEAACLGIPSICSDVYGLREAIIDNKTGLRCKVGDADSLYNCMVSYYEDRELVQQHGSTARERVLTEFQGKDITKSWVDFYHQIMS